jgi:transketolase
MVSQSLEAAEALASEGINATVVDMHTLKPLDGELVDRLVADCGAIVTAEDHSVIGGLGGAVAEHLTANTFAPLERVGVQDRFGESGQADEMLDVMQISAPYIAAAAKRAMARKD